LLVALVGEIILRSSLRMTELLPTNQWGYEYEKIADDRDPKSGVTGTKSAALLRQDSGIGQMNRGSISGPDKEKYMHSLFEAESREELTHYAFGAISPSIYSASMGVLISVFNPQNKNPLMKKIPGVVSTYIQLIFNIFLQFILLYYIKFYICAPAVRNTRVLYQEFTEQIYPQNVLDLSQWNKWDMKKRIKLCQIPLSEPEFFFCLLLVWTFFVLKEVQETRTMLSRIYHLALPQQRRLWVAISDDNPYSIEAMSRALKWVIVSTIYIPKLCIALLLWWLGARWLTGTPNFENLVLNAVALGFILELDELIHDAMLTDPQKVDLSRWSLVCKVPGISEVNDEDEREDGEEQELGEEALIKRGVATAGRSQSKGKMVFTTPRETGSGAGNTSHHLSALWGQASTSAWVNVFFFTFSISLVCVYLQFQQVLPDYRWDVHQHCAGMAEFQHITHWKWHFF